MARTQLGEHRELSQFEIDPSSVRLLPLPFAKKKQVVVLGRVVEGDLTPIYVGMADAKDQATIDMLHRKWMPEIVPVQLTAFEVQDAQERGYGDGTRKILTAENPIE